MQFVASALFLIGCLNLPISGATVCKPLSKFRIDCNICTCSNGGTEYFCTNNYCEPIPLNRKFNVVEDERGYTILKPKNEQYVFDDDNSFVLSDQNTRKAREGIPYINDEMPSDKEYSMIDLPESNNDEEPDILSDNNDVDMDLEEANNEYHPLKRSLIDPWDNVLPIRRDIIN